MRESLHVKVVLRAAQIIGGASALAEALGVSLREVQAWMRSEVPIPESVYCELLDVIAEDTLGKLSSGTNRSGSQGASS